MTSILLNEYVEQVDKLIDDNRLVEAIEHCRHILHSYPRHIDTYRVMGKALLEKQDYAAATDLFLRILSADPNDFISHVGLSIIYKEETQYDQALWHLERAHEIQPYNAAIQNELRQLYATQTEVRPGIIPLSRGALSRLYMQGELYQQAISELRRILLEEPDRMDLQVLLAEALWRDDQRIDAEEVCLNILQELPNCIVANAILAEIWLQTGRIPEAQKYLHRLHGLTQQTQNMLNRETIAGQAFATEGAFPLPEKTALEFLQTGAEISDKPAVPTDDWVSEVKLDEAARDADSLDQVVLEPESGMHSYDWLSDIGELEESEADSAKVASESDWFSQDKAKAKDELNIGTGELNAEWLADLRGEDDESGFQPLDMGAETNQLDAEEKLSETDWFSDEDEILDDLLADSGEDLGNTAVSPADTSTQAESEEGLLDWLDDLADDEPALQIDATNLMDDSQMDWLDSEPHVVEESKTPFWLSNMANEELEAVQLNPEEALNWVNDMPDEAEISEASEFDEPDDSDQGGEATAVVPSDEPADEAPASLALDTDSLGEADDWLAALTEGEIDEEIAWEAEGDKDATDPASQLQIDTTTDELAALSDADDWLQSAASDLDAILEAEEIEEEEFPNLAIPELEGNDITDIPDWLDNDNFDLTEESEAAVSSENDPQETPQPEEPNVEPDRAQDKEEIVPDELDWLNDFASETTDSGELLPDPPIETEGMPSWLEDANNEADVEVVDEWDSQAADIPDWLQNPVHLSDLDEDGTLLDESEELQGSGLTGLLSEMETSDEALPLHKMDSLLSDWDDEDDSLTDLLGDFEVEETPLPSDELMDEAALPETAVPDQPDAPEEMGLTGLLSNLTLQEAEGTAESAESDDDFLADFLTVDEVNLDDFLTDDDDALEPELEGNDAIDLSNLDLDNVSLTALLSDAEVTEEPGEMDSFAENDGDDWLSDLTDLTEAEEEAEPDVAEEVGLTGMLANLWPDEAGDGDDELGETAVANTDDPQHDLEDQNIDEMGLTELLAGIDYVEEEIDSEPSFPDYDMEPAEPSLTEVLTNIEVEPEEEAGPVSAEDTTWLAQLEADTGALEERDDTFDMAEETGLDWLTTPDEPEAEVEEIVLETDDAAPVVEPEETDGTVEDWDDAMSWLEELAAQHDEPLEELPSVAETMLDEELDTAVELPAPESMDDDDEMDWLADLTGSETFDLDAAEEEAQPELSRMQDLPEEPSSEVDDLFADEEVSWLDELATDMLASSAVEETQTAAETVDEMAESELDHEAWLDELYPADEADDDGDTLLDFATLTDDVGEALDLPDLELDEAQPDLDWLDAVVEETAVAEDVPAAGSDEAEMEAFAEEDDEKYRVTGVTDALKESSRIEEAEADLEEALAWLDELDEEPVVDLTDEAPPTRINATVEETDFADEPETIVVAPEPDELSLALDRLEWQVREEGVTVPATAEFPLSLSPDALNDALDWIEQQDEPEEAVDAVEAEVAEELLWEADEPVMETAVVTEVETDDEMNLAAMSEDPEAWLEQLLSDDLDMNIEMEPPPIKPSEDAVYVTGDALPDEEEASPEASEDEVELTDSLLDDVTLDGMPDDPDAAVAWLDQLVSDDETPEGGPEADADDATEVVGVLGQVEEPADEAVVFDQEDDPEAWLEQMLSGDMLLDIDMEPPPIKPSEDAMFVTEDARSREIEPELMDEPDEEPDDLDTAVSAEAAAAEVGISDMEDDPEAWLEQMLSDDFDMDVEMEPPPIKPSEDAMFVTDDGRSHEEAPPATEVAEQLETEAEVMDPETDIIADVPDDPDEAMIWLEQLAARQGAAIEELPSVTDDEAESEMPSWMVEELDELAAEPDLELVEETEDIAEAADLFVDSPGDEADDADIDAELPDWLDAETDRRSFGQTDWLRALPDVDVDTWLSAEEEATVTGSTEEIILPDTGPLTPQVESSSSDEALDDNLFEPVIEPSTGAYSVDEAKLHLAQEALGNGRINEAIDQFKELVAAGTGMMTIIAELEQAAEVHVQTPALSQVLGDAYMRNGQLQKALASYRFALDQM